MPDLVNNGDFNPGCIYRIELENFVTYKKVELFPGKSLNLIIGPNGTGKSTFVCAIILGLCGKPINIGRDATVKESSFIKKGYKSASIEIELYNKKGLKNIIIKRIIFEKSNSSHWYINNEKVQNMSKVREIIKPFNIQVDNLCQLLPQDKVQEFSALKPTELLESTLNAVGKYDSIKQWKQLIDFKNKLDDMSKTLRREEKELKKLKSDNESLQLKIEKNKQLKQYEKEKDICEKKLLWLDSQALKAEVAKCNKEKMKVEKLVNSYELRIEPLKNDLEHSKNFVRHLGSQKLSCSQEIRKLKDQLKKCIESFEKKQDQLKLIDISYKEKLNDINKKKNELIQAKITLDKLLTDKRSLELKVQGENNLKLEYEEIQRQKQLKQAVRDNLNRTWTEKISVLDDKIRLYDNQIRKMKDVQSKRLEILKRPKYLDTYNALMWLRKNRDKFKHPVYEPMLLEINFTDPKFARYLESTVLDRDLIAFTFESTEDMNLFNNIIRTELKLKLVNAVNSEGGDFNIQRINIENLRHLGFYTCLMDTVIAPPAILRYLCNIYNIHNIPIGTQHTYMNSEQVPGNIKFYFSENHRYTVRVSAYGSKSSTTIEINNSNLLANTVDREQLTTIVNKLQKCKHDKEEIENESSAKLPGLDDELQELDRRKNEKRTFIEKIKEIKTRIDIQTKKINAYENAPKIDIEREKAQCKEKYKDCVTKQCNLHSEMFNIMNIVHNKLLIEKIYMIQIQAGNDDISKKDSNYRNLEGELQAVTTKLREIQDSLQEKARKAKQKFDKMMQALNGKQPTDPTFPYAKEFNDLPEDREGLIEYRDERNTKIYCMEKIDSQTLKDYENKSKKIDELTNSLRTSNTDITEKKQQINSLKSEWLPPLESFIEEVSAKFSKTFKKSGRAGELILYKGNGDEDFAGYGINMMVKFRQEESLSVMTRHCQSGGERALTTAIYLLALQTRTVAPFRCVDEINQGLDPINEREMLQLLIKETTKSNSQYFILSPTLLLDLEYNDKVMVHTVMNGKHIVNYNEWNNNEFLRRARNISN